MKRTSPRFTLAMNPLALLLGQIAVEHLRIEPVFG